MRSRVNRLELANISVKLPPVKEKIYLSLKTASSCFMPLIIVTGYPKSGKTTLCNDLLQYFRKRLDEDQRNVQIVLVNDETLHVDKLKQYKDSVEERKVRAEHMSTVARYISRDTLVIADATNYIKGYRYQLYCHAKGAGTRHCVLHRAVDSGLAHQWNRECETPYSEELMTSLISRYEEPLGFNRWDSPLLLSLKDDTAEKTGSLLYNTLFGDGSEKLVTQNLSTVLKPIAKADYLTQLQETTRDIVMGIVNAYSELGLETVSGISVPRTEKRVYLSTSTVPTLAQLKRLARAFIALSQRHTMGSSQAIADSFVDYLNSISLQDDFLPISNRRIL